MEYVAKVATFLPIFPRPNTLETISVNRLKLFNANFLSLFFPPEFSFLGRREMVKCLVSKGLLCLKEIESQQNYNYAD